MRGDDFSQFGFLSSSGVCMRIDIWSDVACPFCYIGKATLDKALQDFDHADAVELVYHSYLLNPGQPVEPKGDLHDYLAKKLGVSRQQAQTMNQQVTAGAAEVGLTWNMDKTIPTNLIDAHRLLHFAAEHDRQQQLLNLMFDAYFADGLHLGHPEVLADLAEQAGLDRVQALEVLGSDKYLIEVQNDIDAAHRLGVQGVPFFVINDKYGISGAQPQQIFASALQQAWQDEHPLQMVGTNSDATCTDEACTVSPAQP